MLGTQKKGGQTAALFVFLFSRLLLVVGARAAAAATAVCAERTDVGVQILGILHPDCP